MSAQAIAPPLPANPPVQRVQQLKSLIKGAAAGNKQDIQRLLSPFITEGETVIDCDVTAKFGLIPTYDFAFLTDRRIGDLAITPLTGNLNVEVAFLNKIDAYWLVQPAFPILLRMFMGGLYLLLPVMALEPALRNGWTGLFIALLVVFLGNLIVAGVINPIIKRTWLRFKKSGLLLKLTGSGHGVLIFSDRDKFAMLSRMSRQITELKRRLDTTQIA